MSRATYFDLSLEQPAWIDVVVVDTKLVEKYGDVLISYGNTTKWVKWKHVVLEPTRYIIEA